MALLLAGLMALAGCRHSEKDGRQEAGDEIRRALGGFRPIEPRLSLDTGWAPCAVAPRSSTAGASCSTVDLLRTGLQAPHCSPSLTHASPGFRQLFGLVRRRGKHPGLAALPLLLEPGKDTTRATIAALEAFGRQPDTLSDLSAAYLHLAGLTDRPELLLESLEASSEALEFRPDDLPARFNQALALSRLGLTATAGRAWETYLETASADGWAAEARSLRARSASRSYRQRWRSEVEPALHQAALRGDLKSVRTIVARHRQRSREWAERELLLEWASASGERAREALEVAGRIGKALAETSGDRMLADGVRVIVAAPAERDVARLRTGHRALAAGLEALYGTWQLDQARGHFKWAHENLAGSPYALWADLYLGLVAYYQNDYKRARASLEALEARVAPERYPALAGRVLWIEGLTAAASTYRLGVSVELYQRSLQAFCAGGEEENLATVHALLAEVLSQLGRFDESWPHLYNALARGDRIFDPVRHHAVLEAAIFNVRRQGLDRAGLAFAGEHLSVARRTGSPQILHYALMHLAGLRYARGDLAGARADFTEAARVAEDVRDPSLRQRTAADFELVSAEIQAGTDPGRAIPRLSGTIEQYERTQYAYLLPQAYGARAQAYLRLGDLAAAERDLGRQIRIYEGSADETRQDVFRLSLLDQAAPAFDEMIELQATQLGRPVLALEYCERGRYRAFLNAWKRAAPERSSRRLPAPWARFDLERLQAGLPAETAILEISLLDDHLLSWVITRSGVRMIVSNVKRRDVVRQIYELARGLGGEPAPAAGRELYDLLIRPATPLLDETSHLVVVPDKELFRVPFEALVDRQTGRYLVEDRTVSYAPSAALFVHLLAKSARLRKTATRLAVAVTGAYGGGLRYERLPQAPAEARSIAALYPCGSFLANPSKDRFLAALRESQVLHFSGHAVSNAEQPFASKLVLADTPAEHVELYAYELYDRTFPDLELVVLSACGTAEADRLRPGLGIAATLAGPFLAAGVPQVIGSQWRVTDGATRQFFASFHRRLAKGAGTAEALRATKLELLHSGRSDLATPRVWAAFVLVGG